MPGWSHGLSGPAGAPLGTAPVEGAALAELVELVALVALVVRPALAASPQADSAIASTAGRAWRTLLHRSAEHERRCLGGLARPDRDHVLAGGREHHAGLEHRRVLREHAE